jgi:predicted amidophosphoribosyltransferase
MSVLADLIDLVFPRRCVGCGNVLGVLCVRCAPSGPAARTADGVWSAARYDGAVRAALLAYKERGRRDLAAPLADLLARAVGAALLEKPGPHRVALVPAPSLRAVAAARGGDHVLRLARRAGSRWGVRTASGVLALTRQVSDSAGLGIAARRQNLAGAIAARAGPPGLAALVVDDIVTTGATVRACVEALETAGWPVVGAAVVAATPRRSPPGSRALAEHRQPV